MQVRIHSLHQRNTAQIPLFFVSEVSGIQQATGNSLIAHDFFCLLFRQPFNQFSKHFFIVEHWHAMCFF